MIKTKYFDCQCICSEHVLRFIMDTKDGELWTEVYLDTNLGLFKRIWVALKYIFKIQPKYGHFGCTLIKSEDIPELQQLLEEARVAQQAEASGSNPEG